jgi:hypothetical protein
MKHIASVGRKLAVTTGRLNPLHLAHQTEVFTPMLQITSPEFVNAGLPFVCIMGSSGDDRDLHKNPFSYPQRVDMATIAISDLLKQSNLRGILTKENQEKLDQSGTVDWLINKDAAFPKHFDNKESNSPPKLDSLANFLKEHCEKHDLPLENLHSYVSVKPGELGREYQLYGKRYENMHQMTAVASGLGFDSRQDVIEFDQNKTLVGATEIRHNLAENFSQLSPKIFKYVQHELAKALLNNRKIGDDPSNDQATEVDQFVKDLNKQGKILSFNGGSAKVTSVPEEHIVSFMSHIIKAETPNTTPKILPETTKFKQDDMCKTTN